jgi:hypothetical protein
MCENVKTNSWKKYRRKHSSALKALFQGIDRRNSGGLLKPKQNLSKPERISLNRKVLGENTGLCDELKTSAQIAFL